MLDAIQIDPQDRSAWEPRLWPHRETVAVSPDDENDALRVLSRIPGATLVIADAKIDTPPAGQAPSGVSVSQPLHSFLNGLAASLEYWPAPSRVTDSRLHESVIGGFTAEIAGRDARIAAAQTALADAEATVEKAQLGEIVREAELREAQAQLNAAEAARELTQIEKEQEGADNEVRTADTAISELDPRVKQVEKDLVKALADKDNHDQQVAHARDLLKFSEDTARQRKNDHDEAVRRREA